MFMKGLERGSWCHDEAFLGVKIDLFAWLNNKNASFEAHKSSNNRDLVEKGSFGGPRNMVAWLHYSTTHISFRKM